MSNPFDDLRKQLDGQPPAFEFNKRYLVRKQYDQMVTTVLEQLKDAIYAPLHVDRGLYRSHYVVHMEPHHWAISLERRPVLINRWEDYVVVRLELQGSDYDPTPNYFSCYRKFSRRYARTTGLTAEELTEALKSLY